MDILPNLQPNGGYDKIMTAIDVFSKRLFAYPVTRITASAVARVIRDILHIPSNNNNHRYWQPIYRPSNT